MIVAQKWFESVPGAFFAAAQFVYLVLEEVGRDTLIHEDCSLNCYAVLCLSSGYRPNLCDFKGRTFPTLHNARV